MPLARLTQHASLRSLREHPKHGKPHTARATAANNDGLAQNLLASQRGELLNSLKDRILSRDSALAALLKP